MSRLGANMTNPFGMSITKLVSKGSKAVNDRGTSSEDLFE